MAKFNIDSSGYNIAEVEEYIDSLTLKYEKRLSEQRDQIFALRNENAMLGASLNDYKLKEEEVSKALVFAVEKSEQMEKGSKKVYDLEIRRLRLMYSRWREVLDCVDRDSYTGINGGKFAIALQEFEKDLEQIIKQNEGFESRRPDDESVKDSLKENSSNYIKNLLNRMDYLVSTANNKEIIEEQAVNKKKNKSIPTQKTKLLKTENIKAEAKEQTNLSKNIDTKKENEKLLNINRRFSSISNKLALATGSSILDDDIPADNAYYRNITQDTNDDKFDLESVLSPKEDLAEIMKAFEDI